MSHAWHTNESRNVLRLIREFTGFEHEVDEGFSTVEHVMVTNQLFKTAEEARTFVIQRSYGGETAYIAAYTTKKLTKGYQEAFRNFMAKHKEYTDFQKRLTIAYGRTAAKVTCPECTSSINLRYGTRFKSCPVCGSSKIISDSNWKTLDTKKRMSEKAADQLAKEAEKCGVMFVCGIEWHC